MDRTKKHRRRRFILLIVVVAVLFWIAGCATGRSMSMGLSAIVPSVVKGGETIQGGTASGLPNKDGGTDDQDGTLIGVGGSGNQGSGGKPQNGHGQGQGSQSGSSDNGSSDGNAGSGVGAGSGTGAGNGDGTGIGTGAGNGDGASTGNGAGNGNGTGTGTGVSNGNGTGTGTGTGNGDGTGSGTGAGNGNGTGSGTGVGNGTGSGSGTGAGNGTTGTGSGTGTGTGSGNNGAHPEQPVVPAQPDKNGDGKKLVALTFDDGPDKKYTTAILDILKEKGVKATFFVVGQQVKLYPEVLQRIADEGHTIGNHTQNHKDLKKQDKAGILDQINKTDEAIEKVLGKKPALFRAPFGSMSDTVKQVLQTQGRVHTGWTVDTRDWAGTSVAEMRQMIIHDTKPNGIILMHSFGSKHINNTVQALPDIIDDLHKLGYTLVTVDELS